MVSHKHHKAFIGVISVIILIVGLGLGFSLASNLDTIDLEIVNIGMTFTNIILLLIVIGLVLEVKEMTEKSRGRK